MLAIIISGKNTNTTMHGSTIVFSYNKKIVEPYIDVLVFLPLMMMANMVAETCLVYDQ
jgi:hypothetical protein